METSCDELRGLIMSMSISDDYKLMILGTSIGNVEFYSVENKMILLGSYHFGDAPISIEFNISEKNGEYIFPISNYERDIGIVRCRIEPKLEYKTIYFPKSVSRFTDMPNFMHYFAQENVLLYIGSDGFGGFKLDLENPENSTKLFNYNDVFELVPDHPKVEEDVWFKVFKLEGDSWEDPILFSTQTNYAANGTLHIYHNGVAKPITDEQGNVIKGEQFSANNRWLIASDNRDHVYRVYERKPFYSTDNLRLVDTIKVDKDDGFPHPYQVLIGDLYYGTTSDNTNTLFHLTPAGSQIIKVVQTDRIGPVALDAKDHRLYQINYPFHTLPEPQTVGIYTYPGDSCVNRVTFQEPQIAHIEKPEIAHIEEPKIAHIEKPEIVHIEEPQIAHIEKPQIAHIEEPKIANTYEPITTSNNNTRKISVQDVPTVSFKSTPTFHQGIPIYFYFP